MINDKNIKSNTLTEGSPSSVAAPDLAQLQAQIRDMQMEIDILKETINVLKKDPGINQAALKNSYYYQEAAPKQPDKYKDIRNWIRQLFCENKQRYRYRHIYGLLKREECTVSEKVVRRIMREERLTVICKRRRKYNFYRGEISPSAPHLSESDRRMPLIGNGIKSKKAGKSSLNN